MNNYKGLFTFDVDNHRYLPIEQADGLISDMFYNPEPKEEPKGTWTIDPMNEDYIDDGKYTAPDELERYEELGLTENFINDILKERGEEWHYLKSTNQP